MTIGAVDIGGTKVAVGMVDHEGKVLSKAEFPSDADDYGHAKDGIIQALRRTARDAGVEISGIGIGSTGPIDPFTGEFGAVDFLPGWRGKNLMADLSRAFGIQAAMENDGDAAVLGEAAWGVGKRKSRLIYVTVGTGIGGGMVLDGNLYRGVDGSHPEVGHHVVDLSGPQCSCGFRGCWEALATGPAMAVWLASQVPKEYPYRQNLTAQRICELAAQGDEWASRAVERESRYLGLGLANLINLLTPDAIVLGGSIFKSASLFLDGIHRQISSGCKFVPFEKTELLLASLGEDANLIGAARVWHFRCGPEAHNSL